MGPPNAPTQDKEGWGSGKGDQGPSFLTCTPNWGDVGLTLQPASVLLPKAGGPGVSEARSSSARPEWNGMGRPPVPCTLLRRKMRSCTGLDRNWPIYCSHQALSPPRDLSADGTLGYVPPQGAWWHSLFWGTAGLWPGSSGGRGRWDPPG